MQQWITSWRLGWTVTLVARRRDTYKITVPGDLLFLGSEGVEADARVLWNIEKVLTTEYFPKVLKWLIEALFIVVGRVLLTGTFCWFIPLCSLHIDILSIHTQQPPPVLKTDQQQFNMQQFLYAGFSLICSCCRSYWSQQEHCIQSQSNCGQCKYADNRILLQIRNKVSIKCQIVKENNCPFT